MINRLSLSNFQSHKDSLLEFHPGVNVIVGSSDSGKTAILRALRWLIWNKPGGDSFRSHWGGNTEVTANIGNSVVERVKTNSSNSYVLDGQEFKAFGTDPPEPITAAINLTEVNIQKQLDAPFLLSETPGEVARHFNRAAHLDVIDSALKKVQSKIRVLSNSVDARKQQKEEFEAHLESYNWLDKAEAEVEVLEYMESDLLSLQKDISKVGELSKIIGTISKELESYTTVFDDSNKLETALRLTGEVALKTKELNEFDSLVQTIKQLTEHLAESKEFQQDAQTVDTALMLISEQRQKQELFHEISTSVLFINERREQLEESLELVSIEPLVIEHLKYSQQVTILYERSEDLRALLNSINESTRRYNLHTNQATLKEQEFHKNFPDICPLCGK